MNDSNNNVYVVNFNAQMVICAWRQYNSCAFPVGAWDFLHFSTYTRTEKFILIEFCTTVLSGNFHDKIKVDKRLNIPKINKKKKKKIFEEIWVHFWKLIRDYEMILRGQK